MGVITACNPGERRDRRTSRQTGYWSKLELISSGFNRRPCPKSNHGRNMMSALGLQMHMYTHECTPHSFTNSWPLLGDNVILHLQNAKKVNPSNTGQCMVFVPHSWFNTLCSFASGEDGQILLQVSMRWTRWVPGWLQNAIWPPETPDIYENFGMLSPAFQMSIEGSRDKDSVNHKWPIMFMMLSIHNSQWTNEIQGDLG